MAIRISVRWVRDAESHDGFVELAFELLAHVRGEFCLHGSLDLLDHDVGSLLDQAIEFDDE